MHRLPTVCLSLILLSLGCDASLSDRSLGEGGRVAFNYRRSCWFGCPLQQPLLVGTREEISLSSQGSGEGVAVRSDAEAVASFSISRTCFCQHGQSAGDRIEVAEDARCDATRTKLCEAHVQVLANAAGDAPLELIDADGVLIDRTTVYVREAERARFMDPGGATVETFAIFSGETRGLQLRLYDGEGQRLLAPEGVHWRSDDADIAVVSAWLSGSGAELDAGLSVTVEALHEGQTKLWIDVPGLKASIPLDVL